jgi:AcrR family transcriptional regulator
MPEPELDPATEESEERVRWHERTLERSLQSARVRAISKADRFMSAAIELLRERGQPDFTMLEVAERAGMSLRTFYYHFGSKDDLLLAIIEESIRTHLDSIREAVQKESDPIGQLRAFVYAYYGRPDTDDPASRGMSIFHLRLAESRADDYTAAYKPQIELLLGILEDGRSNGAFRTDLKVDSMAQFITDVLVYAINMRVLGTHVIGEDLTADELWALILPAISASAVQVLA